MKRQGRETKEEEDKKKERLRIERANRAERRESQINVRTKSCESCPSSARQNAFADTNTNTDIVSTLSDPYPRPHPLQSLDRRSYRHKHFVKQVENSMDSHPKTLLTRTRLRATGSKFELCGYSVQNMDSSQCHFQSHTTPHI